jgi:NAD-dependent deacetylase
MPALPAWLGAERLTAAGRPPDREKCGDSIWTAAISFGQPMAERALRRAEEITLSCDLFLSLVPRRRSGFGRFSHLTAKRSGAGGVIPNRDATTSPTS